MKVLVDNSVRSWGMAVRPVHVALPDSGNPLVLFETRKARNFTEVWLQNEIECLPTVARLARGGHLKAHTYAELKLEAWKRPGSFPRTPFGDVFQNVDFLSVPAAVRRGLFFQTDRF